MWFNLGREDIGEELKSIQSDQQFIIARLSLVLQNQAFIKMQLGVLMANVQIAQEDLDSVGSSLEALVEVVRNIDTSKLPDADKTALLSGLQDLTSAINEKVSPATPVEPPVEEDVDLPGSE